MKLSCFNKNKLLLVLLSINVAHCFMLAKQLYKCGINLGSILYHEQQLSYALEVYGASFDTAQVVRLL